MSGRRGTTLVSVMVAAAIVAIALVGASSGFISRSRLARHATCYTAASQFAEGVMERTCAQPFSLIRNAEVKTGLPELQQAKCRVIVTQLEPELKEITVTCSWFEGKKTFGVRFSTLAAGGERR